MKVGEVEDGWRGGGGHHHHYHHHHHHQHDNHHHHQVVTVDDEGEEEEETSDDDLQVAIKIFFLFIHIHHEIMFVAEISNCLLRFPPQLVEEHLAILDICHHHHHHHHHHQYHHHHHHQVVEEHLAPALSENNPLNLPPRLQVFLANRFMVCFYFTVQKLMNSHNHSVTDQ